MQNILFKGPKGHDGSSGLVRVCEKSQNFVFV